MTMHNEPITRELVGGPHDGMEVDVCGSPDEIRRETSSGMARYVFEAGAGEYVFMGYVQPTQNAGGGK